jgi:ankyrin repeat protein
MTAAAQRGDLNLAELLLQHGAEVSGAGALPGAAARGHMNMVRWLIDHDANLNEIGVHDYGDRRKKKLEGTALHQAVAKGNIDLAMLLVDRGARTDVEDPMGRTPFMRAKDENQQEAIGYLESIGVTR